MTSNPSKIDELKKLCVGNAEAMDFLLLWQPYAHGVDDIDDGDIEGVEDRNGVFIQALEVYTHPFFRKHWQELKLLVVTLSCDYTDSVLWENSPEKWQREEADAIRHSGSAMVRAVAYICAEEAQPGSGWRHLRSFSLGMRHLCYVEHHGKKGEVT